MTSEKECIDKMAKQDISKQINIQNGYDNKGLIGSVNGVNGDTNIEMDNIDRSDANNSSKMYEPYKHRIVAKPTTYSDTIIHLLKASLGTGILAMPVAFKHSGFVVGTVGTTIIGVLCLYTIHLLIDASYEQCVREKVPQLTYEDTVYVTFKKGPLWLRKLAPIAKWLTSLLLFLYQIGSSTVYIVFISDNISEVVEEYYHVSISRVKTASALLIPLCLISSIRSFKRLSALSQVATCLSFVSFVLIFTYIFDGKPSFEDRRPFGTMETIPLFFGTVLFAMEAIGVILPLEADMKHPENFGSTFGVLNMSLIPITLLYTTVGLFGYLKYGENVNGSITLSLPKSQNTANFIRVMYSISIYSCYSISNFVAFKHAWENIGLKFFGDSNLRVFWEYISRAILVFSTYLIAVVCPTLECTISLIGAICLSLVGILMPALVHFLTFYKIYLSKMSMMRFCWYTLCSTALGVVAIIGMIVGVHSNIVEIIRQNNTTQH